MFECCKIFGWKCHSQIQFLNEGGKTTRTLSHIVKKSKFVFVCDFTLQCDISTKQTDVFLSIFLLLSKIAFRVLPRDQNFFYITFFVVNATVVLFLCFASCVFFLSRCFWIFKFPIRSQKLICLMCVWLVFVPLKLLRLFTEKKKQSALIFRSAEPPLVWHLTLCRFWQF